MLLLLQFNSITNIPLFNLMTTVVTAEAVKLEKKDSVFLGWMINSKTDKRP